MVVLLRLAKFTDDDITKAAYPVGRNPRAGSLVPRLFGWLLPRTARHHGASSASGLVLRHQRRLPSASSAGQWIPQASSGHHPLHQRCALAVPLTVADPLSASPQRLLTARLSAPRLLPGLARASVCKCSLAHRVALLSLGTSTASGLYPIQTVEPPRSNRQQPAPPGF